MITAIIIDDEKSGRETLNFLLEKNFGKRVKVLATGKSVSEAVELIEKHDPQLVFLDIEMPGEMGLSLADKINTTAFEIVVTTAHKEYGIDAIKIGVLDYLLKPIDVDDMEKTILKAEKKIAEKLTGQAVKLLLNQVDHLSPQKHKIPLLVSNNKTLFVEPEHVIRCEADGNYTKVFLTSGKTELITKLIKDMEDMLAEHNFFRVHKSHLINIDHVKAYLKADDDITMTDDSSVPLSRNIKADFLKRMKI
ncbi:MAG: response regulator transcription factor [Bacteroidia bacterium]|nr:response regulator transcription factor [Bacteroidia bacterium]